MKISKIIVFHEIQASISVEQIQLFINPVTYNLHNYVPCLDIEDMLLLNDGLYVGLSE